MSLELNEYVADYIENVFFSNIFALFLSNESSVYIFFCLFRLNSVSVGVKPRCE